MRLIPCLVLMSLLTGCGLNPKVPEVAPPVQVVTSTPVVPEVLFTRCKPEAPMPSEKYMKLDQEAREKYLSTYLVKVMGRLRDCNNQLSAIRDLLLEQTALTEEKHE